MTRQERRQIVKEHIEQVLTRCFPNDRFLHDQVRHANGFVGQNFVGMAMPDKERQNSWMLILAKVDGKDEIVDNCEATLGEQCAVPIPILAARSLIFLNPQTGPL